MKTFSAPYMPESRRIIAVTGHYGSGKTEYAVSLALLLAAEKALPWKRLAVVDLDIANPYFRSRERGELLEKAGVKVYGSAYHTEITAELPALDAAIRAPLEDEDCCVIVDLGGNDAGAKVIHQFRKYFERGENELLFDFSDQQDPEYYRHWIFVISNPEYTVFDGTVEMKNWKLERFMPCIMN